LALDGKKGQVFQMSASQIPSSAPMKPARRWTAPAIQARKLDAASDVAKLVMVTAYDAPSAKIAHRAGADMILVGDSLAMVVLGYDDTLQVTTADMAHHTAAVSRGLAASEHAGCTNARPMIVGDLPWMSYHVGIDDAVKNAATLLRAGAGSVKLEGGRKRLPVIQAILDAEIPVMGHIGLTPQSVNTLGGFKVQGKQLEAAQDLIADAKALAEAGCFAIVLEAVPDALARVITETIDIPTIGIGAGADCDGQVLVWHDVLGIEDRVLPKFVRRYANVAATSQEAVAAYAADVRSGAFPSAKESYAASPELIEALRGVSANRVSEVSLATEAEEFLMGLYGSR
jgi:3-methyl-2-oxobutanoate hydroxymethyltransferase